MPKKERKKSSKNVDEKFTLLGRKVVIRAEGKRVELVIDNVVHEVRFLKNGRPFTSAYVNIMATSVRDYAERFIKFTDVQQKHWIEVDAARKKDKEVCD